MVQILIVSYDWPPRNAMGSHRAYQWAKFWSLAGAKVSVLTAQKQLFDAPFDLELPQIAGVRVMEVPYGRNLTPLVSMLKVKWFHKLARLVSLRLLRLSGQTYDPRSGWSAAANEYLRTLNPSYNVIVTSYEPFGSLLIGVAQKKLNPSLVWVADFRDLGGFGRKHSRIRLMDRSRVSRFRTLVSSADLVTTVSPELVNVISDHVNKPVLLAMNGYDTDYPDLDERSSTIPSERTDPLRIVYTGTMNTRSRDLRPLLNSLRRLERNGMISPGEVVIEIYGSRVEMAVRLSKDPSYARYLQLKGGISPEESRKVQRGADILLLLEGSESDSRGSITGKVFEYLVARRPVLCVGPLPHFDLSQLIVETGVGQSFGPADARKLDETILATLDGKGLFESYRPVVSKITAYSRENQSMILYRAIEKFLEIDAR